MQQGGYYQPNYGYPIDHPNSTAVLVLGILSIVFAGLIGLILAIIALNQSANAKLDIDSQPGRYTESSISRIRAGRICAIISLALTGLALLIFVLALATLN